MPMRLRPVRADRLRRRYNIFPDRHQQIRLDNDESLRRINLNMFSDWSYSWTISTGNNPGCVYVYTRDYGDYTEIAIDKFEVYGPNGYKLTPFVCNPDLGGGVRYMPNEDGVIRLDSNFRAPDIDVNSPESYVGILPMSSYTIVLLQVEYEGRRFIIRTQPAPGQSDLTTVDDVTYAVRDNDVRIVNWPGEGDAVIPESIEVDGNQVPVTTICSDAFISNKVTSVEIPESVTTIQRHAFYQCNYLTDVVIKGNTAYGSSAFYNCENLESLRVASTSPVRYLFENCPKLVQSEILSFPSDEVKSRGTNDVVLSVKANIFDLEGNRIPLYARTISMNENIPVVDGIVSVDKSLLYTNYNGVKKWDGNIYFNWEDNSELLFNIFIPENTSGVESVYIESEAPVRYFNLQGMPVDKPLPGCIYIRCQGNETSKVLFR